MARQIALNSFMCWLCFGLALLTAISAAWTDIGMLGFSAMFYALALAFYGMRRDEERARDRARRFT